jgi:hypothetical protein
MPGTVTVTAARPGFGRAGRIKVSVDGTPVGKVRQGTSMDFTVDAGEHRFRVSGGGLRSKEVVLPVTDDGRLRLYTGVHGVTTAITVPLAGILGYLGGILAILPVVAIFAAIPGLWFYLRASELTESAQALDDAEEAAVESASGEPWWVNDPNLAKRYRNG